MKSLRLLLLSDLHGNSAGLKKLQRYRMSEKDTFDAIVISGDFPVTTPFFLILQYMIRKRNLSRRGYSNSVYKGKLRKKFVNYQIQSIETMMESLEKFNTPILYIPGNIETFDSIEFIKNRYPDVIYLDETSYALNNTVEFFGLGGSLDHLGVLCDHEFPETVFNNKINIVEQVIKQSSTNKEKIFIFHEPPRFERTQQDLDQLERKSKKRGYSYTFSETGGSDELYRLIENYNPMLAVNGHYHEYPGRRTIKNTEIVNPGAFATYNYAICSINIDTERKIRTEFYKIKPNSFSFTNFLYQKRNFTSPEIITHK